MLEIDSSIKFPCSTMGQTSQDTAIKRKPVLQVWLRSVLDCVRDEKLLAERVSQFLARDPDPPTVNGAPSREDLISNVLM